MKNGRFGIFIHGNNVGIAFNPAQVLKRAADTQGQVNFGFDRLPRSPDLARLFKPFGINDRSVAGYDSAHRLGPGWTELATSERSRHQAIRLDGAPVYGTQFHSELNEERLRGLNGAALETLHEHGYLQAIYMMLASMPNFRRLVDRKNRAAQAISG